MTVTIRPQRSMKEIPMITLEMHVRDSINDFLQAQLMEPS